jgi:hypothetical protein
VKCVLWIKSVPADKVLAGVMITLNWKFRFVTRDMSTSQARLTSCLILRDPMS